MSKNLSLVCAALLLVGLAASPVSAQDLFSKAGLTGGDNVVGIAEIKGDGQITFVTANPTMSGVQRVTGPSVVFAARCKRSGYRCEKVQAKTDANFSSDKSEETGTVQADLIAQDVRWTMPKANADQRKKRANAEAELISTLKAACAAGQDEVDLKISVRLTCKRVKTAIGDDRYYPHSAPKLATYKLNCR
jgi:hypothetical protein